MLCQAFPDIYFARGLRLCQSPNPGCVCQHVQHEPLQPLEAQSILPSPSELSPEILPGDDTLLQEMSLPLLSAIAKDSKASKESESHTGFPSRSPADTVIGYDVASLKEKVQGATLIRVLTCIWLQREVRAAEAQHHSATRLSQMAHCNC